MVSTPLLGVALAFIGSPHYKLTELSRKRQTVTVQIGTKGLPKKGRSQQCSTLSIFSRPIQTGVLWRGAVESVEDAKARIQELTMASPGEYIMLDQNTGHRALLGISGSDPAIIAK
jgi:hypothetical protein